MKTILFKKLRFLFFFLTCSAVSLHSLVLSVEQVYQNQTQWCWAGTSKAVLDYYGFNYTQEQIALYGTNGTNDWNWLYGESSGPTRRGINLILMHFGSLATTSYTRALTLSESTAKINEVKPFFIRWGWSSGGGHFVVGHGFSGSTLYLMDPWYGPTINTYSWVVSGSSHTWTHSLTLVNPPAVALPKNPAPANSANSISTNAAISWTNIDAAETVQVYFGTENPPTHSVYSGSVISSLTNTQIGGLLSAYSNYYWKVNATRGSYSYDGTVWSFQTLLPSLPDVTEINVNRTGDLVSMTWNPVTGANFYRIYVADEPDPASWGSPIATVNTNRYSETSAVKKFYLVVASSE